MAFSASLSKHTQSVVTTVTSFYNEQDQEDSSELYTIIRNASLYLILLVLGIYSNLRVLCFLAGLPAKVRKRPTNMLVGHMSFQAILTTFLHFLLIVDYANILDIWSPGMCKITKFLRYLFHGVFSLNIAAIIYDSFRSFFPEFSELLTYRLLVLIWLVGFITSLPSLLTIEYVPPEAYGCKDSDKIFKLCKGGCTTVPILGYRSLSILYEVVKFIIFHLCVILFMAFAIIKLYATMTNLSILKPIPNPKMRRKVLSLRFICLLLISFVLVWFPVGAVIFVNTIIKIILKTPNNVEKFHRSSAFFFMLGTFYLVYIIVNPILFLRLFVDNKQEWSFFCCFGKSRGNIAQSGDADQPAVDAGQSNAADEIELQEVVVHMNKRTGNTSSLVVKSPKLDLDFSRVSTVGFSSESALEIA